MSDRNQRTAALILLAAGAAAALFELRADPVRGWTDLLVCAFLFLALALAGQVFLAIHYAASAGWWTAFRRVPEALMSLVPLAALPMLAIWLGRHTLYSWTRPGALESDPVLKAKSAYLNEPLFLLRMIFFLALWSLFSVLLRRASLAQDAGPDAMSAAAPTATTIVTSRTRSMKSNDCHAFAVVSTPAELRALVISLSG